MEGAVSLAHRPIAKTCGRLPQELTELAGNWQGKETPTDYGRVTHRGLKGRRNSSQLPGRLDLGLWITRLSRCRLWIKLWITNGLIHMPRKRMETAIGGRDGIAYTYPLPNARKRRHGPENGIVARCPFRHNRAPGDGQ